MLSFNKPPDLLKRVLGTRASVPPITHFTFLSAVVAFIHPPLDHQGRGSPERLSSLCAYCLNRPSANRAPFQCATVSLLALGGLLSPRSEVGRGRATTREEAAKEWLDEGVEDDLSATIGEE